MMIRNVTRDDLERALATANARYGGNLCLARCVAIGNNWRVRLRVRDSRGPGHRVRISDRRRTTFACWHAHGDFFDALPKGTEIILAGESTPHRPGDPWQDRNIGSLVHPVMFSELCDCER